MTWYVNKWSLLNAGIQAKVDLIFRMGVLSFLGNKLCYICSYCKMFDKEVWYICKFTPIALSKSDNVKVTLTGCCLKLKMLIIVYTISKYTFCSKNLVFINKKYIIICEILINTKMMTWVMQCYVQLSIHCQVGFFF